MHSMQEPANAQIDHNSGEGTLAFKNTASVVRGLLILPTSRILWVCQKMFGTAV